MRYLMFLLGLLLAGTAQALDCEVAPTCEELGYSTEDDPYCADDGYMYCPLDHSYKKCVNMDCAKMGFTEDDKTSWCGKIVKCKGNPQMTLCQNLCEVGDVYYSDGTCGYADDYDASLGKIPVGVVFYVTDNGRHGKVVALQNAQAAVAHHYFNRTFSSREIMPLGYVNYDNLKFYNRVGVTPAYKNRESEFFNGKENTAKMLQGEPVEKTKCETSQKDTEAWEVYCQSTAALKCLEFAPSDNPKTGKGNWYLPALGEWLDLYGYDAAKMSVGSNGAITGGAIGVTKAIVDQTFKALKQKGVNAAWAQGWEWYWTSTKEHSFGFFTFNITGSVSTDAIHKEGYVHGVRPMLQF